MSRRITFGALAALSGLCACDAGEIAVFQGLGGSSGTGSAGAAGMSGTAGISGTAALSGAAGSSGSPGSVDTGGSAGLPSNGAGQAGAAGPADRSCRDTSECDKAWVCEKQACTDELGMCAPRPSSDDPSLLLVCGCDGVTYWNDTLRRKFGISASTDGECRVGARACDANLPCDPGATCSHLLPPMTSCASPGSGTCWVTPADCPTMGDRPHWLPCPPPDGSPSPSPPPCRTMCQAVQSGLPHTPAGHGPSCP